MVRHDIGSHVICNILFIRQIPDIHPRAHAAKSLTSAFGARTAVFATPRAFHSPWLRMLGAIFQTLGWFGRRLK